MHPNWRRKYTTLANKCYEQSGELRFDYNANAIDNTKKKKEWEIQQPKVI